MKPDGSHMAQIEPMPSGRRSSLAKIADDLDLFADED
jgi:hypothetical protein